MTWIRHDHTPASKQELLDRIGDRKLVLSISGGKDSSAMACYMKELGIPFESIFMDTGWELEPTYDYLKNVLPAFIGPIKVLRLELVFSKDTERISDFLEPSTPTRSPIQAIAREINELDTATELKPLLEATAQHYETVLGFSSPMIRLILHKGMFPSRVRRFCTQMLKVQPAMAYILNHKDEVLNVVGIRAEESLARSAYPEWEWDEGYDSEVWRPLLNAKFDDVVRLHHRHGVPPSPLYVKGASRVGCAPCIYARKHEIRMLHSIAPARFLLLQHLEQDIDLLSERRAALKGEVRRVPPPTWFQNPVSRTKPTGRWKCGDCKAIMEAGQAVVTRGNHGRDDVVVDILELHKASCPMLKPEGEVAERVGWIKEAKRAGECWSIQKVVTWSYTKRGGREWEPFAPMPSDEGCMRWGLCDTSWRGAEADGGADFIVKTLDIEGIEEAFVEDEDDCSSTVEVHDTFEGKKKVCPRCQEEKDIENGFGVRRIRKPKKKTGDKRGPIVRIIPQSYCRSCRSAKARR